MACTLMCVPSFSKAKNKVKADLWPDGTAISEWFRQNEEVDLSKLGKQYKVTDYGVVNDGLLHTSELQALIDKAAKDQTGAQRGKPQKVTKTEALKDNSRKKTVNRRK